MDWLFSRLYASATGGLLVDEMEKWTRVYGCVFLSLYDYLTTTRASQQAKRSEVGE